MEARVAEACRRAATCSECNSPIPRRGRHACPNLGVFCCNRCYGIFRQVGAHVARAKCVGLDSFPEEEVKRLEALGNAGAKDFWEANLTSTAWTKPTEQSSNEEVRRWIVAKYERASFIPSGENKPSMPPLTDRTRQSHSPGAPLQTPFPVATPETNSSDVVSLIDL